MTGKTHKFLGMVVGGAIAYHGVVVLGEPLYALAFVSSPVGAMLADIDHNNSKIGSARKKLMKVLIPFISILITVASAAFLVLGYLQKTFLSSLITLAIVLVPLGILSLLTKLKCVQKHIKFITKHRGLMHTLFLPAFLILAVSIVVEPVFSILLEGLALGYMTHLFADMLTVRGCPILFPLTKKNFRFLSIRTGTAWEYVAAGVIAVGIAAITLLLDTDIYKMPLAYLKLYL